MGTTSDDYCYEGEVEYAAAVAAAAFAISTLDSATQDEEPQNVGESHKMLDRIKSQKERASQTAKPDSESESSPDERKKKGPGRAVSSKRAASDDDGTGMPEKIIQPVPVTRQRSTFKLGSNDFEEIGSLKPKFDTQKPSIPPPPPPPPPLPSTRRRPTFSLGSKDFEDIDTQKPGSLLPPPPPIPPPFTQPVSRPIDAQKPRFQESEADAWERAELDKIRKRYEELNLTILDWEEKRKKKAKRKLDRTEGDSGRKRAKALQVYQDDIERIRQITDGARAQAKEKRRNEELKVKAKADKYRATGEPPATCLCF